ncbi:IMPACT family protein [Gemella sp. oral taxon 928]|uniref:YigZ family protein n=1 Tax=Gemella sp. oral taxon 928 TaxID=1785995 RepID=UPI0007681593|nr:YigZ family protein [Gemella sp. oral taxon 928]AME10014.1 IMPACT family protein [Gemella sp. oral taxon 928]
MSKQFITIKENSYDEFIEKKSTFITHLVRINNEEDAKPFIQKMRKKHYNATHVCSCYVIGDNNEITRANDDGEPSGTAGTPMLDILVKNNIKNVCAVVIRYYGGTKLGTGGLVRAYSGGVINALKNSTLVERKNAFEIKIELDYNLNGKIEYEIQKTNFIVNHLDYTDKIIYTIYVIQEDIENFNNWIADITNGKYKILSSNEKQLEFEI